MGGVGGNPQWFGEIKSELPKNKTLWIEMGMGDNLQLIEDFKSKFA